MNAEIMHHKEDLGPDVNLVEICPACGAQDLDCPRCDGYGIVDVEEEPVAEEEYR